MSRIFKIFVFLLIIYAVICFFAYMVQEKLIFFPEELKDDFVFEFPNRFEERFYSSPTGNRIHALFFPSENAKGVILYFHGNAGSLRSWGNIADDFLPLNYHILIPDYPGYGKSKGALSEKNLFEDARFLFDELKKEIPDLDVVLYGRSLGTAIAAHLAHHAAVKLLVLESPFYSLTDFVKKLYPYLPSFLLKYPFRTDLIFQKIKCPVYVLHGTNDEVIPFGSSRKLETLFKSGDAFFPIEGGYHNDLSSFPEYHKILQQIFK